MYYIIEHNLTIFTYDEFDVTRHFYNFSDSSMNFKSKATDDYISNLIARVLQNLNSPPHVEAASD